MATETGLRQERPGPTAFPNGKGSDSRDAITGPLGTMTEAERETYLRRIREGRVRLETSGTEDERRADLDELMAALAATRAEQGRPF